MLRITQAFISILLALTAALIPAAVQAGAHLVGDMNGAQEVPPLAVGGLGTASIELNDTFNAVSFDITVTGLTGAITSAHFHNAASGVNGGVVRDITTAFAGGTTARGIWKSTDAQPLTPALVAQLLAGRIYVNVHTVANGGGEIRGQLILRSGIHFRVRLDGSQEVPPVVTAATGTSSLVLTSTGLQYDITAHGLTGAFNNAHFHQGAADVNGGVLQSIFASFVGTTATGTWALTPAQIELLLARNIYVNLHTTTFGAGEIRGQLEPVQGSGFTAIMDGAQEVPPVVTGGKGTLAATLVPDSGGYKLIYLITVTGLAGAINNAHFHVGATGVNGIVVKSILTSFSGNSASGEWKPTDAEPLTAERVADILGGRIYVNIHTTSFGSGEIRGQLRLKNGPAITARMSGAQESPPVATPAEGTAACTLTDGGLRFSITYDRLAGTFADAHFHSGPLGTNGPVVRSLGGLFAGGTAQGTWAPTDAEALDNADLRDLLAGNIYVNIHSNLFGGGEIRGQLGDYAVAGLPHDAGTAGGLVLAAGRPNPFRSAAWIRYELPSRGPVRLRLLDIQGREVAVLVDAIQDGTQELRIDGTGLHPGVYFLHLSTPAGEVSRKLVRLR